MHRLHREIHKPRYIYYKWQQGMESHPQIRTTAPHIDFALRIQVDSIGCPDSSDRRGISLSPGGFCACQASLMTPSPSHRTAVNGLRAALFTQLPRPRLDLTPTQGRCLRGNEWERSLVRISNRAWLLNMGQANNALIARAFFRGGPCLACTSLHTVPFCSFFLSPTATVVKTHLI